MIHTNLAKALKFYLLPTLGPAVNKQSNKCKKQADKRANYMIEIMLLIPNNLFARTLR